MTASAPSRLPHVLPLVAALALSVAGCDDGRAARGKRPEDRTLERAEHMLAEAARCADGRDPSAERAAACRTACDLGHSNSCHGAGALREAAGDATAALALYERACGGGSGLGCESAGRLRRAGLDGAPEPAAAERLDRRARFYLRVHCEQRHAPSCLALGRLYATRRGGPADAGASATFLARACSLGLTDACHGDPAAAPPGAF